MRIVIRLAQLTLGFAFGAFMTFGHQASLRIGEVELHWGLALAIFGSAALLLGVRLVTPTRTDCFVVALGMLGAIALLSFPGPGGSVLIPANLAGTIWAFSPTVIAILVLAWPNPGPRKRPHAATGDQSAATHAG